MAAPGMEEGLSARFLELCRRSLKLHAPVHTRFLSPPEAALAKAAARENGLECALFGGYKDAERVMACFHAKGEPPEFPVLCVHIVWDGRFAQAEHRSILGAVLGLGIDRSVVGDICLDRSGAYLMAAGDMAAFIAENLASVGSAPVKAGVLPALPDISPPKGREFRDTVASLRLDAVLAAGLNVSRADAAALVKAGKVQVDHRLELRPDAQLEEGSLLSVRGFGRLRVKEVGAPTRKGRIPIQFESHGIH